MNGLQIERFRHGAQWIVTEVGGMAAYNGRTYTSRADAERAMDLLVANGYAEDKPLELALEVVA
jgi:hypothetical protein